MNQKQNNSRDEEVKVKQTRPKQRNVKRISNPRQIHELLEEESGAW